MAVETIQHHIDIAKRVLFGLFVAALIFIPEDLLDTLVTVLHYAYESFEFLLEEIVQHVFNLDKTDSQIYVFYFLIALGLALCFLLYKVTPRVVRSIRHSITQHCHAIINAIRVFWDRKSLVQKTLLILLYVPFGVYILSFFVM